MTPQTHAQTCLTHYEAAMASFDAYGLPADREEAMRWLAEHDKAVSDSGNTYFSGDAHLS